MSEQQEQKKKDVRKQAHQNTYAFRHNPNSKLTKKIAKIPVVDLCRRCTEKIKWRKQYRKYKVQSHLSKCTLCQEKRISLAYNIVCEPCGTEKNMCRICRVVLSFENTAPLDKVLTMKNANGIEDGIQNGVEGDENENDIQSEMKGEMEDEVEDGMKSDEHIQSEVEDEV